LVREAQHASVMIYTVGVMDETPREEAKRARRDLDALAKATGGQAYYLDSLSQVDGTVKQIAHDIRNQYTLAYTPTNQALDGTYRKVSVVVSDSRLPVLAVRTRDGYYAGETATAKNEAASQQ
jgi:VWFA-related protein